MNPSASCITTRFGKTAIIVHALALLAALAAFTAESTFELRSREDQVAVIAMSLSAMLVFGLWSLLLSIRALRRGERRLWPLIVFIALAVEVAGLLGVWSSLWRATLELLIDTGLALFIPFGLIVSLIAVPVARWRVRRAERAAIATGKPEWSRRQRWRTGWTWYLSVSCVLTLLLLPWPLFLFCASCATMYYRNNRGWHHYVACNTPDFVRDGVANRLETDPNPKIRKLHREMMYFGYLSRGELHRHLNGCPSELTNAALVGLSITDPSDAVKTALEIANNKRNSTASLAYSAGFIMGTNGNCEQIAVCLDPAKSIPAVFRNALLSPHFSQLK